MVSCDDALLLLQLLLLVRLLVRLLLLLVRLLLSTMLLKVLVLPRACTCTCVVNTERKVRYGLFSIHMDIVCTSLHEFDARSYQ